jgi:hypothetical protein
MASLRGEVEVPGNAFQQIMFAGCCHPKTEGRRAAALLYFQRLSLLPLHVNAK